MSTILLNHSLILGLCVFVVVKLLTLFKIKKKTIRNEKLYCFRFKEYVKNDAQMCCFSVRGKSTPTSSGRRGKRSLKINVDGESNKNKLKFMHPDTSGKDANQYGRSRLQRHQQPNLSNSDSASSCASGYSTQSSSYQSSHQSSVNVERSPLNSGR